MEAIMVMQSNRSTTSSLTHQAGVTLIELMAGMVVGMTIVAAAFTILTTTSKSLRANEQVVGAQQNLRLAMELLSRDIKLAGFGSPGVAIGNCTYAIMPNDQTATGPDTGPDSVQLLVPMTRSTGSNKWTLQNATPSSGTARITLQPGAVTDMETSGLANGSYISVAGSATAKVAAYNKSASTIDVTIPPPLWFQAGDPIYLLQCIRYQVVSAPDPGNLCGGVTPCLTRGVAGVTTGPNAEAPIAEGIEDLQLAYACDGCVATINSGIPDRSIDDVNAPVGFGQEDFLSNVSWTAAPLTPDKIKLVQIALVARQSSADQGFGENSKAVEGSPSMTVGPLPSDHTLAADPNHRRRVLVKTVDTRNIGS